MENGTNFLRYQRNFNTLTHEEQLKLNSTTIGIVGCGGLGGYIAEELTRLGVGHLILIDGDRIEESNLNRQLFALEENISQLKVEAAKDRLSKVNSSVKIDIYPQWFTEESGKSLLQGADLVCDALDNGEARILLEKTCYDLQIPLVLAAIGGWYGMLGVCFPGDFVAERLFRKNSTGVEKQLGNPAFGPAVIASLAVAEAIKVLTGRVTLRNRFLYINLLNMEFDKFNF